ncbi:hypothetical protein PYV61_12320, partial [Roseisolibacter sp. H3M3-2]|nr:hypothetical protein [Roseisolibacter sp. H3M3-2]
GVETTICLPKTAWPPTWQVSAGAALRIAGATLLAGAVARALLFALGSGLGAPAPASDPRPANVAAWTPDAPTQSWDAPLVVVDRRGVVQRALNVERPWTPRFSPDGRRVAYGAFADGRGSSDVFVTDLEQGTTRRLTDDDGDSNDPQWSPDGRTVAFSVGAPGGKDIFATPLSGGPAKPLASRNGTQFASDWVRDGRTLVVTDDGEGHGQDVYAVPLDGSPARRIAASDADESAARVSPDGRWVVYTSNVSGQPELYLDSFTRPGRPVAVTRGGGQHAVWRADGRELFFWRDGVLVSMPVEPSSTAVPPDLGAPTSLFKGPYPGGFNTMYDVSPDGQRFVIVRGQ